MVGTILASKIRGGMSPYKYLGYSQHQRDQKNISENNFLQTKTFFFFFFGQNWFLFPTCTKFKNSHLNKNCLLCLSSHLGKHLKLDLITNPFMSITFLLFLYFAYHPYTEIMDHFEWKNIIFILSFWVNGLPRYFFWASISSNLSRHHLTGILQQLCMGRAVYLLQTANYQERRVCLLPQHSVSGRCAQQLFPCFGKYCTSLRTTAPGAPRRTEWNANRLIC